MSRKILDIENINYCYPGHRNVLEDINLKINQNDLIVIRGESGAGKSTFLKLFNRFCGSAEGKILFHDRELKEYEIEELRKKIIYLSQVPHIIEGSIEKNLSFPFSFHVHRNKKFYPESAKKWLEYFELKISLNQEALKLSIGQKQRIALIRAILLEPEILLLDEPASALDAKNKRLMEQQIQSLIESSNLTVIMATHSEVSFTDTHYREFMVLSGKLKEVN
jgi:putative ABC transport system ATP-binding protein